MRTVLRCQGRMEIRINAGVNWQFEKHVRMIPQIIVIARSHAYLRLVPSGQRQLRLLLGMLSKKSKCVDSTTGVFFVNKVHLFCFYINIIGRGIYRRRLPKPTYQRRWLGQQ